MSDTATSESTAEPDVLEDGPFIQPVAMEDDPDVLFPGDRGVLDADVRRVLARLLQRRFLLAERNRDDWAVLIEHQPQIESRLNDIFVRLVVDHERGVAYKEQVRADELDIPILLKDDAYTRAETLVLVHLRVVYQRESTAGRPRPGSISKTSSKPCSPTSPMPTATPLGVSAPSVARWNASPRTASSKRSPRGATGSRRWWRSCSARRACRS